MSARLENSGKVACEFAPTFHTGQGTRIMALDALRQLAALVVFVSHFFIIFEIGVPSWCSAGLFDGKAAVGLFFVLSGYVLALSLKREEVSPGGYLRFGIRRILRIYPMHLAATAMAFFILVWIRHEGGFMRPLRIPVDFLSAASLDLRQWLLQVTLVMPGMDSSFENPPVWTLTTEARIAIIFPFLAWTILRSPKVPACLLVAGLVLASAFFGQCVLNTLALVGQFALGALLARIPLGSFNAPKGGYWWVWLAASIALYSCVSLRYVLPTEWMAYYLGSLGAAGFIVAAIHWDLLSHNLKALQSRVRADVSYGFYILHFPLMLGIRKLTGETTTRLSAWLIFAACLVVTLTVSVVLMVWVEKPAIELGRRLTRRGR